MYISYLPVAAMKCYDQSILEKEGLILAMVPEAEAFVMVRRHGGKQAKQHDPEAENSHPRLQAGSREKNWK